MFKNPNNSLVILEKLKSLRFKLARRKKNLCDLLFIACESDGCMNKQPFLLDSINNPGLDVSTKMYTEEQYAQLMSDLY